VRLRLATSPWWVQGLVYGTFFGVFMTLFYRWQTGGWLAAALGGLSGGIFFGLFMGVFMSRLNRRMLAGLHDLAPEERREVLRASWRGPVPLDGHRRAAARVLLQKRRDETVRTMRWSITVFVGALVLEAFLAITRSPWWWLGAALFLGFLIWSVTTPARMDRRLALLDERAEG
jgi:hypothetical protein